MKKLLLLLLSLSLLLCSCAAEQYDLLYETEVDGLTYCVRGSGTRAKQVVVKQGDEVLWSKRAKVAKDVGSLGGDYGLQVADLNFDGHNDVMIATEVAGDCVAYLCWLYDTKKETYVKNEELTGLCNVAPLVYENENTNVRTQAVFAFEHTYETEQAYDDVPAASISSDITTMYVWQKDGTLKPEKRVSITYYSESTMYCYSVSWYDDKTGKFEDSDDKWMTPEEYKTYDMSFLYYFK